MLDMGFRPAVDRIVGRARAKRQTMFFSATLEGDAGRVAREYTREPQGATIPPAHREAVVEHRFVAVSHADRVETLVRSSAQNGVSRSYSCAPSAVRTGS